LDKGAYLSLWVGATLLAALRDVPIVWNAPGVNLAFTELEGTNFVSVTTAAADMIAVRDERSRANLSGGPTSDVAVVPDTALDIDRVWPKARLADVFRRLLERKEAPVDRPFVAFHIKKRSLGGLSVQRVVEMLDEFAGRVPALPILLALGPCHGDDVFARELSEKLGRPHVLLDDPQGIEEIASAIAGSVLYLGSSLHGYITAYAYEIPSLLVTVPRLDKFEGFLEQIDRVEDACADWVEAFDKAAAYNAAPRPYDKRRAAAARAALDRHWSSLVEALGDKERRRSARRDFLYGAADLILSRSDWGSLSEPFVHQAG
jgi:polysaccharide pyruvyl transferase WcaK-like protein